LEFVGDFSSPRSPTQVKGGGWASARLLGREVGLSTRKKKERDVEKQGGPAWKKKGGRPAGLTQEKLGFGPLPNRN
jgi:hypothetical protein